MECLSVSVFVLAWEVSSTERATMSSLRRIEIFKESALWPFLSLSRNVSLSVYMSPFRVIFFKAFHWPLVLFIYLFIFWEKSCNLSQKISFYFLSLSFGNKSHNPCKIVSVLLSTLVERFFVSHMRDFFLSDLWTTFCQTPTFFWLLIDISFTLVYVSLFKSMCLKN